MLSPVTVAAFYDELEKIAVKVPFIHGTHAVFDVLRPGVGRTILRSDPNPRAVYTAMRGRTKRPGIKRFAEEAAAQRGGSPTIASGKMDTKKGWAPKNLTAWGKKNIGSPEDASDLVEELDSAVGKRRGEIWKSLNKGVGAWRNIDPKATLKVTKSRVLDVARRQTAA
jgi:hypothetical protein